MLKTIIFSLGSLIFTILLFAIYSYKSKTTKHENKYYRNLLLILCVVLITEIISAYTILQRDKLFIINEIVCHLHCLAILGWVIILACYIFSIFSKKPINYRFYLIGYIILSIIFFALPLEYVVDGNSAYLTGYALYFVYALGILVVISALILIVKNKKEIVVYHKIPIIISIIETIITIPLSIMFPTIYILTSSFAFKMYLIYFAIENPDLFLISELEKAKNAAESSNKAKSDFLSNMSHEIKTPINAIVGFSEALINDPNFDEANARKEIEHIYAAGGNLLEIINNILDISKIENEEETLEEKEYSLKSILLELHSIISSRLTSGKVKFLTKIDESLPDKLYGDKTKVFQVLLNILSNAVKYTEVGKIELSISGSIENNIATMKFRVLDTGMGIKKENYDLLFEKFSRLDSATQKEIEGTGLGLLITKKLVTLMGGKIWFESTYGAGSSFYIELTQKIASIEPMGDIFNIVKDNNIKDDKYFDCSNYKVLIVDDNELNLKVAKRILEKYNFQIQTLNSGKECIDLIKSGEDFDMVFLDHMMPGLDGIEVLHILKSLESYNIPPIVALTANAITGMKEMYLNEGFDEYLSKPINISDLNKLLEKYFKK